jgi:hypothetical protein
VMHVLTPAGKVERRRMSRSQPVSVSLEGTSHQ